MQQRKQDRGGERVESIAPFRPLREGEPQAARRLPYTPQIRNWWALDIEPARRLPPRHGPRKTRSVRSRVPTDHALSSVKQEFDKGALVEAFCQQLSHGAQVLAGYFPGKEGAGRVAVPSINGSASFRGRLRNAATCSAGLVTCRQTYEFDRGGCHGLHEFVHASGGETGEVAAAPTQDNALLMVCSNWRIKPGDASPRT